MASWPAGSMSFKTRQDSCEKRYSLAVTAVPDADKDRAVLMPL